MKRATPPPSLSSALALVEEKTAAPIAIKAAAEMTNAVFMLHLLSPTWLLNARNGIPLTNIMVSRKLSRAPAVLPFITTLGGKGAVPNSQSSSLQRQDDGSILGELALALLRRDRLHLLDLSYFLRPEPRNAFDQLRGTGWESGNRIVPFLTS